MSLLQYLLEHNKYQKLNYIILHPDSTSEALSPQNHGWFIRVLQQPLSLAQLLSHMQLCPMETIIWMASFCQPNSLITEGYLLVQKAPYIVPCAFLVSTKAILGYLNRNATIIKNLKTQHWHICWTKAGQINSSPRRKILDLIQFLSIGQIVSLVVQVFLSPFP